MERPLLDQDVELESSDELGSLLSTATTRSASGAKQGRGTTNTNAVNSLVQCYLNPGAWTGSRTDIGVVVEDTIMLCSVLAPPNDKGRIRGDLAKKGPPKDSSNPFATLDTFIDHVKSGFPDFTVLSHYKSGGFKFTADGHVIVFIPDMHVNLFRGMPIDAFHHSTDRGRVSHITTMVQFLDCLRAFPTTGYTLELIQLGDLVDNWHTQSIFLEAHRHLQKASDAYKKKHGVDMAEFEIHYTQNNEILAAPNSNSTTERVRLADWPGNADAFHAWIIYAMRQGLDVELRKNNKLQALPLPYSLRGVRVNYTSYWNIETTIMAQYPEMRAGGVDRWAELMAKWTRGNHDMDRDHPYFGGPFVSAPGIPTGYSDRWMFEINNDYWSQKPELKTQKRPKWNYYDDPNVTLYGASNDGYGRVTGLNDCIWYEHGHAFDPYNHRSVWFREDAKGFEMDFDVHRMTLPNLKGGFPSTLGFVRDVVNQHVKRGKLASVALGIAEWAGDAGLEVFSYERTQWVFDKYGKKAPSGGASPINLVVMGHTHVPHIEDYAEYHSRAAVRRVSLFAPD